MKRLMSIALLTLAASGAAAEGFYSRSAQACFSATEALQRGVDPAALSTADCERALTRGPHTAAHRAAMLHNRGLIERAQGQLAAARASFEAAVAAAEEVGPSHIALAQLAAATGDVSRAAALYRELAGSESRHPMVAQNRDLFRRNLAQLEAQSDYIAVH